MSLNESELNRTGSSELNSLEGAIEFLPVISCGIKQIMIRTAEKRH
jgi:hypothetical protein